MSLKVIPKSALPEWIDQLCADYQVAGPRRLHEQYVFSLVSSAADMDLHYDTTILPPKKFLLPPRETLLHFQEGGRVIEEVCEDGPPLVLFGVHSCDLHAIQLLDQVFRTGYADQHYLRRRENLILVSIECLRPCMEDSFCKSMGTLGIGIGFDLHLTEMEHSYSIDIGTERGAALLEGVESITDATDADYRRINQTLSEKWPRFSYRLDFDATELPSLLSMSTRSRLWEELGEKCLACGMCTNVCPTCYCFNVVDEVDFTLASGDRQRVWDSCQLDSFATVAGGHNFREKRAARQRHRFFRKGKYLSDAFGILGCVGCGRCAHTCPVHISPVIVFNELYRRRAAQPLREEQP